MEEMRAEFEQMKMVPRVTLWEMIHNIGLRTPLIISMMVMLSQQLSGINAVSESRMKMSGVQKEVVRRYLPPTLVIRSCISNLIS